MRKQLKERAFSEDVQIVRIEMIRVTELIAGCAFAAPPVVQAKQAVVVERERAFRKIAAAFDSSVPHDKRNKDDERRKQQGGRYPVRSKSKPRDEDCDQGQSKPPVSNADELVLKRRLFRCKTIAARCVLLKRIHAVQA